MIRASLATFSRVPEPLNHNHRRTIHEDESRRSAGPTEDGRLTDRSPHARGHPDARCSCGSRHAGSVIASWAAVLRLNSVTTPSWMA